MNHKKIINNKKNPKRNKVQNSNNGKFVFGRTLKENGTGVIFGSI